jgi:hypothetical protein
MTTKCPKCGSEDCIYFSTGQGSCNICECNWTIWQQSLIEQQREEINELTERVTGLDKIVFDPTGDARQLRDIQVTQEREITRLRGVLTSIEEHPHCDPANCGDGEEKVSDYSHAYGHRCAAEIARKGLEYPKTPKTGIHEP